MTPSDADEGYAHDDDRAPPRRRARRDVLEIGQGVERRSGGRGAEHAQDLDDDRDDGRRRYRDEDRDDDRRPRSRDDRDRRPTSEDDRKADRQDAGKTDAGKADADKPAEAQKTNDTPASGKDSEESQNRRKSRRPLILTIVAIVVLLGLAYSVYYYFSHKGLVSTDDAYTDGYIVAVAPRVSGQVVSLDVVDNQFVHKGDPLVHIDPRPFAFDRDQAKGRVDSDQAQIASQRLGVEIAKKNYPAALQLAQANLLSAKASLQLSESNNRRQQNLPRQATTQQEVDTTSSSQQQAEAAVAQAQARVAQAEPVQQSIGQSETQVSQLQGQAEQNKAQLGQAELNLEFTVVRAQQDGWVTRRNVDTGNYVTAGTQIMSLVTPDLWVTANYKETELNGMRPGQTVKISVDAYPDLDITGHVDSIQHGSGSRFSAFPAENATGNFVKIVQRVPVKIVIDSGLKTDEPLPLGVSVEPTVTVK